MTKPLFITIEGVEGVGKSTLMPFIEKHLIACGHTVLCTREPGGTEIAEAIRQILLTPHQESIVPSAELLLMFASRAQHVSHLVKPALSEGKTVLCDRFSDSSFAYQITGRDLSPKYFPVLCELTQEGLTPDLTLLLDLDPEIGMQRAKQVSGPDRIEQEQLDFFHKVRAGFLLQAKAHADRYRIIDASQSLDGVKNNLKVVLDEFLK